MLTIFIPFLFLNIVNQLQAQVVLDYKKAITNKAHYQVPQDELLLIRYQAGEPLYISSGKLKGHGIVEPFLNEIVNELRSKGILTYTDYFTSAKALFYQEDRNYETCRPLGRIWSEYKDFKNQLLLSKNRMGNKFVVHSIPFNLSGPLVEFGIKTENKQLFEKHKYPGTQVYNIKSIIDDTNLKTIQITGKSSGIRNFIYKDIQNGVIIKDEYKKRVYEFVASGSEQIPLMLNGNRMHWADMSSWSDFYIHKLGLSNKIELLNYSRIHPKDLNKDYLLVDSFRCYGNNLKKLQKIIEIINKKIHYLRGNKEFWDTVLDQYFKDFNLNYHASEKFYFTKASFKFNQELRSGFFD